MPQKGRTPPPRAGLGVAREAVQAVYEADGYTFAVADDVNGQPCVVGDLREPRAHVQLIGPADNLTQASVMVGIGADSPASWVEGATAIRRLVQVAAPAWTDGPDWIHRNLETAGAEGRAEVRHGPLLITLHRRNQGSIVALTVARKP